MPKSQFIPARNSRHRVAVIALYRALIREGRDIRLPRDVLVKNKSPVPGLIKRGFERNRADVSPRLVFAALTAGYRFLTLFRNAQKQGSKEHSEMVNYLREKNEQVKRAEATNKRPKKKKREIPDRNSPGYKPILERVSAPGEPPKYVSRLYPRPRDSFEGRRKIPHVVVTASDHAFLRHRKPQPQVFSDILRRKQLSQTRLHEYFFDHETDPAGDAAAEDAWEKTIAQAMAEEGVAARGAVVKGASETTYAHSVGVVRREVSATLLRQKAEEAAKAKALYDAVDKEKELLQEEVEEAKKHGIRIIPNEKEKLAPYFAHRALRRAKRGKGFKKRKMDQWKRRLGGLRPAPIQA